MAREDRFQTKDLNLAAAAALITGLNPTCEPDGRGRVFFVFPEDPSVRKSVLSFYDGASCVISEYVEVVRRLRSAMYTARGAGQ